MSPSHLRRLEERRMRDPETLLRRLHEEHAGDLDGGFAEADALAAVLRTLPPDERDALRRYLQGRVAAAQSGWGITLEALVEEGDPSTADALADALRAAGTADLEWKDRIVLALLELRDERSAGACSAHIRAAVAAGRDDAAPLLCNLYRVDPSGAVELAASYFAAQDEVRELAGYVPAFAHVWTLESLADLIRETARREPRAARVLARLVLDSLGQPWMREKVRSEEVSALRDWLARSNLL